MVQVYGAVVLVGALALRHLIEGLLLLLELHAEHSIGLQTEARMDHGVYALALQFLGVGDQPFLLVVDTPRILVLEADFI